MTSEAKPSTPPKGARQHFFHHLRASRSAFEDAVEIMEAYTSRVGERYETKREAQIAASDDDRLKVAIGIQQFEERQANMFAQAALLEALYAILNEQRRTNQLLQNLH